MRKHDIKAAVEDLCGRTLSTLTGEVAQLIYIASTRDYSTGRYCHAGLECEYTREIAECALEICHKDVFQRLVLRPLQEMTELLDAYVKNIPERDAGQFFETWRKLQPYRVLVPADADPLTADLFISNLSLAVEILAPRYLALLPTP